MSFRGTVTAIYRAPVATAVMEHVTGVDAIEGVGLQGDRYANGSGTWSAPDRAHGQLTLIEAEALAAVTTEAGIAVDGADSRRNIVTSGVPLNHLVGRRFRVGKTILEGVRLCEPCAHLEKVSGKALRRPLVHRGGLNAIIVTGGAIAVGDPVEPVGGEQP